MNYIKTFFLLTLLTILLVMAGGALAGRSGMTMALIFAFVMNFVSYWFSDKIVLKMYGAKEVAEADYPNLYGTVRNLSRKAGMPMPKVYVMEADQPNAFATGRNPSHAAVAVTTGIMNILSPEELSGVIGHELAHIQNRDILIGTIAATIAGAISYLAQMAHWGLLFGGGRHNDEEGGSPVGAILMMIVAPIAALLVQMAVSRSREYAADESGARIAGNARYLSGALRKLDWASKRVPMAANPATSHMFIVSPLTGRGLMALFSTHPPIEERIKRLEGGI